MARFRVSTLLWLTLVAGLIVAWQSDRQRLREARQRLEERDKQIARQKPAPATAAYPYYTTRGPRDFFYDTTDKGQR